MNSPKILLQSGIGPADELEDLDVIKSDERKTFQSLRFFSTAFLFPLCFEDWSGSRFTRSREKFARPHIYLCMKNLQLCTINQWMFAKLKVFKYS